MPLSLLDFEFLFLNSEDKVRLLDFGYRLVFSIGDNTFNTSLDAWYLVAAG